MTEYRVVNVNAPRCKWNPFKCFDENFSAARDFLLEGEFFASDLGDGHRLESRPVGGGPNDWKEIDYVTRDTIDARRKELQREREEAAKKEADRKFRRTPA